MEERMRGGSSDRTQTRDRVARRHTYTQALAQTCMHAIKISTAFLSRGKREREGDRAHARSHAGRLSLSPDSRTPAAVLPSSLITVITSLPSLPPPLLSLSSSLDCQLRRQLKRRQKERRRAAWIAIAVPHRPCRQSERAHLDRHLP